MLRYTGRGKSEIADPLPHTHTHRDQPRLAQNTVNLSSGNICEKGKADCYDIKGGKSEGVMIFLRVCKAPKVDSPTLRALDRQIPSPPFHSEIVPDCHKTLSAYRAVKYKRREKGNVKI